MGTNSDFRQKNWHEGIIINLNINHSNRILFIGILQEPGLINLGDRVDRLKKRYGLISEGGEKIHALIKENIEFFKANESSDQWAAYKAYIDDMVIDGFFNAILTSLEYFQVIL